MEPYVRTLGELRFIAKGTWRKRWE
jgi:hypothetical protein